MLSIWDKPNLLLKLEGAAILLLALMIYEHQAYSWTVFFWLFLAPDLAMVFYLFNPSIGATTYNLMHAKILPSLLGIAGVITGNSLLLILTLIWFAHIGFDRMLGFGLKYADSFQHTHLGWLGKTKKTVTNEE